jgi:hypothetical protein
MNSAKRKLSLRHARLGALIAVSIALATSSSYAAVKVSTAAGAWSTPGTWSPAGAPIDGDTVTINHAVNLTTSAAATDVTIGAGGNLSLGTTGLTLSGNLAATGGGVLTPNSGKVTMAGANAQSITGISNFHTLSIANTNASPSDVNAVTPAAPITVTNGLVVQDGQFNLPSGSIIAAIDVFAPGVLKPSAGATIQVSGGSTVGVFTSDGTFIHNNSKFVFSSATANDIGTNTPTTFFDVEVNNTAAVPSTSNDTAFSGATSFAGTLRVVDGLVTLIGGGTSVNNVKIESQGILSQSSTVFVSGDWTQAAGGGFTPGTATTNFNGSGLQKISGNPAFYLLTISNTAPAPDDNNGVVVLDAISTVTSLTINDGQFMPADGSSFRNISVAAAGILKPAPSAVIEVFGNAGSEVAVSSFGQFIHNSSEFRFTGPGPQTIGGGVAGPYHDLTVVNTAASPDLTNDVNLQVTVEGELRVEDGLCSTFGQQGSIVIGSDGLLNLSGPTSVSQDFTVDPGGQITIGTSTINFNGSGPQVISGEPHFLGGVNIVNTAASPSDVDCVSSVGPVFSASQLTLTDGQFMPDDGSEFRNIIVSTGGILKPQAGAEIVITGENGSGSSYLNVTGDFVHNGGTLAFVSASRQDVVGSSSFPLNNVRVHNTAAVPDTSNDVQLSNVSVGTVTVEDGMCSVSGQHGSVNVGTDGVLRLSGSLSLEGDWTLASGGTFVPGTNSTIFNGSGAQTISGATDFFSLTINNSAAAPDDATAVVCTDPISSASTLAVTDGQFMPADGSAFRNVQISSTGILKPETNAEITVNGSSAGVAFINSSGIFTHNNSNFIFESATEQGIAGPSTSPFFDLTINNSAAAPDTSNDAFSSLGAVGTLHILDGMFTTGTSFGNVVVEADAILNLSGGMNVSGDWTLASGGSFAPNSFTVIFNGTGPQTVTGATAFAALSVNNTAAIPDDSNAVVCLDPVSSTGAMTVIDGQFMPADNSAFRNVLISTTGILKPTAAAEITLFGANGTSAFLNNGGTFLHNNSTFVLESSTEQSASGPAGNPFFNLTVNNSAAVPSTSNDATSTIGASGTLRIQDGMFTTATSFGNVVVDADGLLNLSGSMGVAGDWTVASGGTFLPNGNLVVFNGTGAQTINSATAFDGLTVNNTAPAPDDSNAVVCAAPVSSTGSMTVTDGQFMPADGSAFRNIAISSTGVLKPVAGASITLNGDSGGVCFFNSSGTFAHNNSEFIFESANGQSANGPFASPFFDVTVNNSAATPDTSNDVLMSIPVQGTLRVADGMCTFGTQAGSVEIETAGFLNLSGSTGVSGDWNLNSGGTLIPNGNTITFNGSGPQSIAGATAFAALTINNTAAAPGDANAVVCLDPVSSTGAMTVTDGQFMPADGSAFRNIQISAAGILKPEAGGQITLNGDIAGITFFNVNGTFDPNGGEFIFESATGQTASASVGTAFFDVTVNNTAAVPDTSNDVQLSVPVTGTLRVVDGMCSTTTQKNDVIVEAAGLLNLSGNLSVSGDWTLASGSAFTTNGFGVTFNGSGLQNITGATSFDALTINNTAAAPDDSNAVLCADPVSASGNLLVSDGQFTPANGSIFRNIQIGTNGILRPAASASITVSGDSLGSAFANLGTFDHNSGEVVFAGSALQQITGATTFDDLTISNTAATPDILSSVDATGVCTVEGVLYVTDGMAANFDDLNTVWTEPDGLISFGLSPTTITGNFSNLGTADASTADMQFIGTGAQSIESSSPVVFGSLLVGAASILEENGLTDQFSVAGAFTVNGIVRRPLNVTGTGILTGGLTGAVLDISAVGTAVDLSIDRIGSVPNAAAEHVEAASWTFDFDGATGYTTSLTLPHALVDPSLATVSHYLGTGTNWDFVQNSFTPTTVTRNGLTDLSSVWAVGEFGAADVEEWMMFDTQ